MSQQGPGNWVVDLVNGARSEFNTKLNQLAAHTRGEHAKFADKASKQLSDLAAIARAMDVQRSGDGIVRIEDLPGRRVPFDFIVDIPIGSNTTSVQEASLTISQEGPFVAVKRYATFQSAYEFQVTTGSATARFSGRSFGRYRPIHSAWDIMDQGNASFTTTTNPLVAGALPINFELPGTMSGFRTMEFDGRIAVENAGSSYPRQNKNVPSSLWTTQINSPQDLGCLDFFERGEVITFRVAPTHVNNPPFGNVDALDQGNGAVWPFIEGQFDRHEGIGTPNAFTITSDDTTFLPADPIQRLPDGILTIGFLGYRIQQPVGPLG